MLHQIDHLLYGTKDLNEGIDFIHQLTGVKPVIGGSHPGLGTHNALLGLSHNIYLEIIAPDPNQNVDRVWMDLDQLEHPKLFRWAATTRDVQSVRDLGLKAGWDIGEVKSGSRYKSDGELLEWTLSDPNVNLGDGLVPFFIDWGESGNPTPELPKGCKLEAFEAVHPKSEEIEGMLTDLGLDLTPDKGTRVQLIAKLQTPKGPVTLS